MYPLRLAIVSLALSASGAAQVQNLGDSSIGTFSAERVSADGSVVAGIATDAGGRTKIGVWTEAESVTLLEETSAPSFLLQGLSDDGTLLAGTRVAEQPLGTVDRQAFVWDLTTGARTPIPALPGDLSTGARAMSADGSTVVGVSLVLQGSERAIRWTASGGTEDLGSLGGASTRALAVSGDGSVIVGSATDGQGVRRPFVWTPASGLLAIPGVGDFPGSAVAISEDGQAVIGSTTHPSYPSGAFYYRPGLGAIELNLAGGTLSQSLRLQISGNGLAAVGVVDLPGRGERGFRWTLGAGATLLDQDRGVSSLAIGFDGGTVVGSFIVGPQASATEPFERRPDGTIRILRSLTDLPATQANAISRDETTIVGGGVLDDGRGVGARWEDSGVIGTGFCGPAMPHSFGGPADLSLSGSNTLEEGQLIVRGTGLPPETNGFVLVSRTPGYVFPVTGSDGALCLGGAIGRFLGPGQVFQSSVFSDFAIFVDATEIPSPSGFFTPVAGEQLYFQAWFRDGGSASGSNFTAGATVRFF